MKGADGGEKILCLEKVYGREALGEGGVHPAEHARRGFRLATRHPEAAQSGRGPRAPSLLASVTLANSEVRDRLPALALAPLSPDPSHPDLEQDERDRDEQEEPNELPDLLSVHRPTAS